MTVLAETDLAAAYEPTWLNERRQYVRCRTIGHAWHDYDSNWKPEFGHPLTLRCARCGTERRDTVSDWGKLLARHYYKPAGYDRQRGEASMTRDDFRVLLLAIRQQDSRRR